MKASTVVAIAIALLMPFSAVVTGFAPQSDAVRLTLLCCLPLILIFKPKFITDYFGRGYLPTLLAWIAFASIGAQLFIFPFLKK
jgi:hypothetical protein